MSIKCNLPFRDTKCSGPIKPIWVDKEATIDACAYHGSMFIKLMQLSKHYSPELLSLISVEDIEERWRVLYGKEGQKDNNEANTEDNRAK